MNEWNGKRIAMVAGLSALAVSAAMAVDQGAAPAGAATPSSGAWSQHSGLITTSSTAFFASPTVHATESGKCVASSPNC